MEATPPLRRIGYRGPNLALLRPSPEVAYERLDPNVRYLWLIGRLIFWGITTFAVFAVTIMFSLAGASFLTGKPWVIPLMIFGLGALALLHLAWCFLSFSHWGYAIRDTDFLVRSGVIWKRVVAIPFARIQHVDSDAGPLDRGFGLANLVIHTAGAQMGSITLPGLPTERASALRDYLSEVGHSHANL